MSIFRKAPPAPLGRIAPSPAPAQDFGREVARGLGVDRTRDQLTSGTQSLSLDGGQAVELASWSAQQPRWVIIYAIADGPDIVTGFPPVEFELSWSLGPFAAPPARFNHAGGPIVLFASAVTLRARHPGAPAGPDWNIFGVIAPFDGGAFPAGRPLFAPQPGYLQNIAPAANAWFQVSPYARRVRVARTDPAQSFKVADVGGVWFSMPANIEMPWMELSPLATGGGLQLQVQNTGALATLFALHQELAL